MCDNVSVLNAALKKNLNACPFWPAFRTSAIPCYANQDFSFNLSDVRAQKSKNVSLWVTDGHVTGLLLITEEVFPFGGQQQQPN